MRPHISRAGRVVHNQHELFTIGRSAMNGADQVIGKLKRRSRLETDTDLAARQMIGRSSVASWRNGNSVPDRYRRIADGEVNWASLSQPHGEMTDVERIAIMRLIRDFRVVAEDYRRFMGKSMEAAMIRQMYWSRTCADLCNAMTVLEIEKAHHCADLLVKNEQFSSEQLSPNAGRFNKIKALWRAGTATFSAAMKKP